MAVEYVVRVTETPDGWIFSGCFGFGWFPTAVEVGRFVRLKTNAAAGDESTVTIIEWNTITPAGETSAKAVIAEYATPEEIRVCREKYPQ
jgi:hypothetical protein